MKNSPSCANVLHKTLNLVISRCCFAEHAKKCTKTYNARAERLFLLIKPIVLWRCRCSRRRRCLSSLLATTTATSTKTSLENVTSRNLYYFAIIPIRSTCTMWAKYLGTKDLWERSSSREGK